MRSSARRVVPILLTLVCFAAPVFAQAQTKQTQPVKIQRGTISGRITIKDKPAVGVAVGLRRAEPGAPIDPLTRGTTDQDGVYRITSLAAGGYMIVPAAPAYVINEPAKNVIIGEDETVDGVNFSMVRGGVITGKVTDADGRPVISQQVNIYRAEAFEPVRTPQPGGMPTQPFYPISGVVTDDRGIYRSFGLPAGRYKVAAGRGDDATSGISTANSSYKQVFHPDAAEPSKATTIEVTEGSEATNVDIALGRLMQTFSVSGRVIDESGNPVPNIRFGFQRMVGVRTEFMNNSTLSNARGDFLAEGLVPGKYGIFMFSNPLELRADTMLFDVIDQDVTGITVKLQKGGSVSGIVVLESEDKTAMAKLRELQLRGFVMSPPGNGLNAVSNIGPDGSFRLGGLPNGQVVISLSSAIGAMPYKGFVVSRIEREGVPARIEIRDGEQVTGVKIIIAYGNASIRGVVTLENGTLPEGVRVMVRLTKAGDNGNVRPPPVDSRLHFFMDGIPPGVYDVSAMLIGPRGPLRLPPVKREVSLIEGVVTDVALTVDLSTLPKP
jgi:protocatechuate 3,4-dioxygenase beta subunit